MHGYLVLDFAHSLRGLSFYGLVKADNGKGDNTITSTQCETRTGENVPFRPSSEGEEFDLLKANDVLFMTPYSVLIMLLRFGAQTRGPVEHGFVWVSNDMHQNPHGTQRRILKIPSF